MSGEVIVSLGLEDVKWAMESARISIEKWSVREGYYDNRFASHLKGKLGELAVEKFLLEKGFELDSHFRFPERENLCDIVVKIRKYTNVRRLEIKTWSASYWKDLGRCVSVAQYPDLIKKADLILWCTVDLLEIQELLKIPTPVSASLMGWSVISEISRSPIKSTGTGGMRKVKNHQLAETDLHPIQTFLQDGMKPAK
ncbi:MAG: hypothetical protein K8S20_13910 [Chloroflexi bacterium]|nr:hypothetical protein [Chloroflexota bacterium]